MINRSASNPTAGFALPRFGRPPYLLGAALLLLVFQLLSGTGVVHALLVFTLLVISYYAVIWAGGLETLFGVAILYLLLQHVLVCQIAKVFFWESADAPLMRPLETMGVYVVGMASIAVGVLAANRFRFRRQKGPLFTAETKPSRLLWMSILCTIFITLLQLAGRTVGTDAQTGGAVQGGVLGPLKQLGFMGPLAITSGTAYMIMSSRGRRSVGLVNGVPIVLQIVLAITSAQRENTVTPVILYGLTCIAFRYRFRLKHYGILLLAAYIANFIIFPYALIARGLVRTGSFETNLSRSANMMLEITQNPFKYRDIVDHMSAKKSRDQTKFDYFYKSPSPTLSRYTLLPSTDGLVDAAIIQGFTGWETITPGFEAALPRFLNPDKPFVQVGNFLAHRVPGMRPAKNDHTTGISIGLFPDAYTCFGWLGISVIPFLVIFCLMTVYRFLVDERFWGNVVTLSFAINVAWELSESSTADFIVVCTAYALGIAVGLAVLYALVDFLDKITARVRYAVAAGMHPRRQALQRVMVAAPHAGKRIGIKRPAPPEKV